MPHIFNLLRRRVNNYNPQFVCLTAKKELFMPYNNIFYKYWAKTKQNCPMAISGFEPEIFQPK